MNHDLLLRVADAIEADPDHFTITTWFDEDDGCRCIAGWALHLAYPTAPKPVGYVSWVRRAGDVLGLTCFQAAHLFSGEWAIVGDEDGVPPSEDEYQVVLGSITAAEAAEHLRRFVHNDRLLAASS